jgi:hypothetical protein
MTEMWVTEVAWCNGTLYRHFNSPKSAQESKQRADEFIADLTKQGINLSYVFMRYFPRYLIAWHEHDEPYWWYSNKDTKKFIPFTKKRKLTEDDEDM